jgi:hypothetical protein
MKAGQIKARWSLVAAPEDMERAEKAVLGAYEHHMSTPEFTMDDEDPKEFERRIDLYPHRYPAHMERMPMFWKLAAELGDKGMVGVNIETDAVEAHVNTGALNLQFVRVNRNVLDAELRERIAKARRVLDGRDD